MIRRSLQNRTMTAAARPGSRAGCDCSGLFKIMAPSSSGGRRSLGELCRGDEGLDFCEVLARPARTIGLGLRINAGWADHGDRFGDILGTEPAGEDSRDSDFLDDAAAQAPVVSAAERPELPGAGVPAVEQ